MHYSRVLVGAVLCVLAAAKILDSGPQEAYLSAILGLELSAAGPMVWVVIVTEMLLGFLLLTVRAPRPATALCLAVIGFGLVTAGAVLFFPTAPACGCFGALAHATMARRLVMSGVLVYLAVDGLRPTDQ